MYSLVIRVQRIDLVGDDSAESSLTRRPPRRERNTAWALIFDQLGLASTDSAKSRYNSGWIGLVDRVSPESVKATVKLWAATWKGEKERRRKPTSPVVIVVFPTRRRHYCLPRTKSSRCLPCLTTSPAFSLQVTLFLSWFPSSPLSQFPLTRSLSSMLSLLPLIACHCLLSRRSSLERYLSHPLSQLRETKIEWNFSKKIKRVIFMLRQRDWERESMRDLQRLSFTLFILSVLGDMF